MCLQELRIKNVVPLTNISCGCLKVQVYKCSRIMYVYVYVRMCMHVCVHVCICTYICMYVCTHAYINAYTNDAYDNFHLSTLTHNQPTL